MSKIAALTADLLVIVHFSYVAFVVVGQILILFGGLRQWHWIRNVWFRGLHLLSIGIVVLESWLGIPCPLTVWEQSLRMRAGQVTYEGDFLGRCVHDLLFLDWSPATFTAIYTLFGLLVLATLLAFPPDLGNLSRSSSLARPTDVDSPGEPRL